MATVRVVSTHPPTQGPYVVLDASQFDPAVHTLYHEEAEPAKAPPPPPAETAPARKRAARKE